MRNALAVVSGMAIQQGGAKRLRLIGHWFSLFKRRDVGGGKSACQSQLFDSELG